MIKESRWQIMFKRFKHDFIWIKGSYLDGDISRKYALAKLRILIRKIGREFQNYYRNDFVAIEFNKLKLTAEIFESVLAE